MKRCDNTSVGVLIADAEGRHLMFRRATFPVGVAPVAGHVDEHGTPEQAARAEVCEELGLAVVSLAPVASMWRGNVCRRHPGPLGAGHEWHLFRAEVTGVLAPDAREARDPAWYGPDEVQALTDRTVAYAYDLTTTDEFADSPGIEPVWVAFLAGLGVVWASPSALAAVDAVACRPLCSV